MGSDPSSPVLTQGLSVPFLVRIHLDLISCKRGLSFTHETGWLWILFGQIIHNETTCDAMKEQGHVTVNKPVISMIYIVGHTWPLFSAQILVDGVNPQQSYF